MKQNTETCYYKHGKHIMQIVMANGKLRELVFTKKCGETVAQTPEMADVLSQLDEYFAGNRKSFKVKMELEGTEFQKEVWKALQTIPFGETLTYKDIAIMIGRPNACRAVGMANHNNPISIIIPCHRVIGANGALTGYAGGLELKQWLLEHEEKVSQAK